MLSLEEYQKLPRQWAVDGAVFWAVYAPVSEALSRDEVLSRDVPEAMYLTMYLAVTRAVDGVVNEAFYREFW